MGDIDGAGGGEGEGEGDGVSVDPRVTGCSATCWVVSRMFKESSAPKRQRRHPVRILFFFSNFYVGSRREDVTQYSPVFCRCLSCGAMLLQ